MLAVEGSPLRQRVHGMWVWLKKNLLLAMGQLPVVVLASSPAWPAAPSWHLAAGPKRGHPRWYHWYSKVNSWVFWREEDLNARRIKKLTLWFCVGLKRQQAWTDSLSCCFQIFFFLSVTHGEIELRFAVAVWSQDECRRPGRHNQAFGPYFCNYYP